MDADIYIYRMVILKKGENNKRKIPTFRYKESGTVQPVYNFLKHEKQGKYN